MNEAVKSMLAKYAPETGEKAIQALREILQEITLLGLSRAKFFEHGAFYGGSAMRILYGLNRFSEDLDFSLLAPNDPFNLHRYEEAVVRELQGFGFEAEFTPKKKTADSAIQSAFLKANTRESLLAIGVAQDLIDRIPGNQKVKIKVEVDTDPPPHFSTEVHTLYTPIPFSVKAYSLEDLFAGKMHAVLFRRWESRVKGRDWYDLVWFVSRNARLNLTHLEHRMRATGGWNKDSDLSEAEFRSLCQTRIESLDVVGARRDVEVFLHDPRSIELWSRDFFTEVVQRIKVS